MELVVVELSKSNNQSIILFTFYRPPSSTLDSVQQLNSGTIISRHVIIVQVECR